MSNRDDYRLLRKKKPPPVSTFSQPLIVFFFSVLLLSSIVLIAVLVWEFAPAHKNRVASTPGTSNPVVILEVINNETYARLFAANSSWVEMLVFFENGTEETSFPIVNVTTDGDLLIVIGPEGQNVTINTTDLVFIDEGLLEVAYTPGGGGSGPGRRRRLLATSEIFFARVSYDPFSALVTIPINLVNGTYFSPPSLCTTECPQAADTCVSITISGSPFARCLLNLGSAGLETCQADCAVLCDNTSSCAIPLDHANCVPTLNDTTCTNQTFLTDCENGAHNCTAGFLCMANASSYTFVCDDVNECLDGTHDCDAHAACTNTVGSFNCLCNTGFSGSGVSCADINECTGGTHDCDAHAACTNTAGSFTCDCNAGWSGSGLSCSDLNECTLSTDNCAVHATCTNSPGSFTCACTTGWSGSGVSCADINECTGGTHDCSAEATCTNMPGSFSCACTAGWTGDGLNCTDDNECTSGTHDCDANAECSNSVGSYSCACTNGFTGDGVTCTDINECSGGSHDCNAEATCTNTPGSFTCDCDAGWSGDGLTCNDVNECVLLTDNCDSQAVCNNTDGSFTCTCNVGYTGSGAPCVDINECTAGTHDCDANAACHNTEGSFTCSCNAGWSGDGLSCADVNECTANTHNCDTNAACSNTVGSFDCMCNTGWSGSGVTCSDVNECTAGTHDCDTNAACSDTAGSFTCSCNAGWSGNGLSCVDVNECTGGTHDCDVLATCSNTVGSFDCVCNTGYTGSGVSCFDINECASGSHDCDVNAACGNTVGSFSCSCELGWTGSGTSCADIDECTGGTHDCDVEATCANTPGSFDCTCNDGYSGSGVSCSDINECTEGTNNCDPNAGCSNTAGSFTCSCDLGYSGNGVGCADINECQLATDNCNSTMDCANTDGSFVCLGCISPYVDTGDVVDARCPRLPVFLLPVTNGRLGGTAGADLLCQTEAVSHSLPGSLWHAILKSSSNATLAAIFFRMQPLQAGNDSTRAYVFPNNTVFLTDFDAVQANGTWASQLVWDVYANGSHAISDDRVWDVAFTGVEWTEAPWGVEQTPDYDTDNDCNGWASGSSYLTTHVGAPAAYWDSTGRDWGYTINVLYPSYSRLGRVTCDGSVVQAMSVYEPDLTEDLQLVVTPRFNIYCSATAAECGVGTYEQVTSTARYCHDLDECTLGTHDCDGGAGFSCVNTPGSFVCTNGQTDPCANLQADYPCSQDASCVNNAGSAQCTCNTGFSGDGSTCIELDECTLGTHTCNATAGQECINTAGSFQCLNCRQPALALGSSISGLCPMTLTFAVALADDEIPRGLSYLDAKCMQSPLPVPEREYPFQMRAWTANVSSTPLTRNVPMDLSVPFAARTATSDDLYEVVDISWFDLVSANTFGNFDIGPDGESGVTHDTYFLWGMSPNFTISSHTCNNWNTRSSSTTGVVMKQPQFSGAFLTTVGCNHMEMAVICTASGTRTCPYPYEIDPRYPQYCTRRTNLCQTEANNCSPDWSCIDPMDDSGQVQCEDLSAWSGPGYNCSVRRAPNFFFSGCADIDECALGTASCTGLQTCTNTAGSFTCT